MPLTNGQTFYQRLCNARETQDRVALSALYHPDAVSLDVATNQVFKGREAILAEFTHTFQLAGAISSKPVENLVEAAGAVCVEATLVTGSLQTQNYDVYMLQTGMVKWHVGGLISPRSAGGQGLPQTKGSAFYQRLRQATQAHDIATLERLYRPHAISVNCSTGQVLWGREAIISSVKQAAQKRISVKLKSVEGFMEGEEIICAEVSGTYKQETHVGPVQFDALTYEVYVLLAGQVGQHFSGLISPRWPELQQILKQQEDHLIELSGLMIRTIANMLGM
jgi:ketosteroid isomerase-like protein